jgi:hypothetical protein
MNIETAPKHDVIKDKAEDIRKWVIECPFRGTLAQADVGTRAVSFGIFTVRRIEIKSCSLWAEKVDCSQECIGNT